MAPRTIYANLQDGLQNLSLFDQSFADTGLLGVIPCTAVGTNTVTLTPIATVFSPAVTAYQPNMLFSFVAANTSNGAVTIQVGTLAAIPLSSGTLTANDLYVVAYNAGTFYIVASNGPLPAGELPTPTLTTLGGVKANNVVAHQWVTQVDTTGTPQTSQPAFADISGAATSAQLPVPTTSNIGGVKAYNAVANQWINSIDGTGTPASTQPAFSNISGSLANSQLPVLNSIADLKALAPPSSAVMVNVNGYYASGDFGGGVFLWNSASSAADNAGTIIQPNSLPANGRWIRQTPQINVYSPEMFGAKCDGSTDDQVAINATIIALNALAGGGTCRFTDGLTYLVGSYSAANSAACINVLSNVNFDGFGTIKLKTNTAVAAASATNSSVTTNVLTVSGGVTGTFAVGQYLYFGQTAQLFKIQSLGTGTGGVGTYNLSASIAAPTGTVTTTATAKIPYIFYALGSLTNVTFRDFTIDYNGANNSGSGTVWAFNGLIAVANGDSVIIDNVKCYNNSGSNDFVLGTGATPITNVHIANTSHKNSGDAVNVAAIDFSTMFVSAQSYSIEGNSFTAGPTTNGAAIEIYGSAGSITGNSIDTYFNGFNIVAAAAGGNQTSRGLSITGNSLRNCTCGFTLASNVGATLSSVNISGNTMEMNGSKFSYYLDADSQVTAGNNLQLNIVGNSFQAVLSPAATTSSAILLGNFQDINVVGNFIRGSYGPAIQATSNFNTVGTGILNIAGNTLDSICSTTTGASKIGIKLGATGTITNLTVNGNNITGTSITTGIDCNSVAATKSLLANNSINGATNDYANVGSLNIDNTAWTSYTPTITATSGTFTTVSATGRYKQRGKIVHLEIDVNITTHNTAAGRLIATLPVNALASTNYVGSSREYSLSGKSGAAQIINTDATTVFAIDSTGTTYIADTAKVVFGITYEAA